MGGREHAEDLRSAVNGCCTSPRQAASGATSRRRSDHGPGSGRRTADGHATAPGRRPCRCCTPPLTKRTGGWKRRPRKSLSTPTAHAGASNGGLTFDDRRGPYSRTKRAERIVAVDVTGLSVAALIVPAYTHESRASELMLEQLDQQGGTERLELVGVAAFQPCPSPGQRQIRTLPIALHTGADRAEGGTSMSPCRPQTAAIAACAIASRSAQRRGMVAP